MNKSIPKLCVVIPGPTLELALEQILAASKTADILEFRLDLYRFPFSFIPKCRSLTPLPVIYTVKNTNISLSDLCICDSDYIDVTYDISEKRLHLLSTITKNIILSHHDFSSTPTNLNDFFGKMDKGKKYIYKIATMANSSIDSFRMLEFVRTQQRKGFQLIGICMGELGSITRILSPVFGNLFTYASLKDEHSVAPGQLSVQTLLDEYHYKMLNSQTKIYGLIGSPLSGSNSHKFHNEKILSANKNAIYCKIELEQNDLNSFFSMAQQMGIEGVSVTMPLKEKIINFVNEKDEISTSCGAINTICFTQKFVQGYNTDGLGALLALQNCEKNLSEKTVVILGAGGAAKAIGYVLSKIGCRLIYLNRTIEKANVLKLIFGGKAGTLHDFHNISKQGYDILINCTSLGMLHQPGCPIDPKYLLPNRIIMETIRRPAVTPLVIEAKKINCNIIFGEDMFKYQAEKQSSLFYEQVQS